MFKAVLFDMDGTIVDSVPAWHRTFNQVLEHVGKEGITYDEFCSGVLGQSTEKDIERFFPMLTEKQLLGLYDRFFLENISSVKLFPNTLKILDYLKEKKIKKGVVTNTPTQLMIRTLDTVGIRSRFETILGGTDVSLGKPNPEIIHKACENLKLKPSEVLMVGDTKADMGAGKNAGCRTIGIGVKGDWTIKNLSELTKTLESI